MSGGRTLLDPVYIYFQCFDCSKNNFFNGESVNIAFHG